MFEIDVHSNAMKHGISESDIRYAWEHFVRMQRRESPHEDQTIAIGYTHDGRLVELIGVDKPFGTLNYHAFEPPTKAMLLELGLRRVDR